MTTNWIWEEFRLSSEEYYALPPSARPIVVKEKGKDDDD